MKKTISLILVLALGLTAQVATADFTFGTPTNLVPVVNSGYEDGGPSISADGLALFFHSSRSGGSGVADLWVTKRPTVSDPWDTTVNLGALVNSGAEDRAPSISADGLELYFHSDRSGGQGSVDIWVTTRETTEDDWSAPMNIGPSVNSSVFDRNPDFSADGLTLYFVSNRPGGYGDTDFWVTTRTTKNADWGTPVHLGSTVNSSSAERQPTISADGLWFFFHSNRPGGSGGEDIWLTTRATKEDDWGAPVNLGPAINTSVFDGHPSILADGSTLYFTSNRPGGYGGYDLWQVSISPVVDFNGDGIVDSADMCIIVDHWGEYYPLCDIGPTPLGDGVVDTQDLIVLAEHLFEDVNDSTLLAHWALDEEEGTIANDSAGTCDGRLLGAPVWQPAGGMVDGALQFDGVDDFILTSSIPNSIEGPFSVFAWVKGGAPGQVVISQTDRVNLLCTGTFEGNLMTELKASGRGGIELLSQTVITDGNWHRIGLVWDGSHRTLYVDYVAVTEDTQANLEDSENRLYIGTGKAMEPGTFWSGLIDDVRIYNRAVSP